MTSVSTSPNTLNHREHQALTEWLTQVPWQIFGTFTFAWHVSDAQALGVFDEFMNRLERFLRSPVTYVRGDEKRFSGCGMPGAPRHFHAVLAALPRIDSQFVGDLWMSMAGRREHGAGADARIYDPSLPGLAYVLKFINQPNGDWDLRNLDLFLPAASRELLNRRQRRRLARHQSRSKLFQEMTGGLHQVQCSQEMSEDVTK